MSWQTYVDTNLVGSGAVSQAAIFGHDGSKWAASAGFNVTAQEAKNLAAGYKDASSLRANGIHLSGVKYLTLRADDRSIYERRELLESSPSRLERLFSLEFTMKTLNPDKPPPSLKSLLTTSSSKDSKSMISLNHLSFRSEEHTSEVTL
eukprot:TRINITY_DN28593_c0_g1_i1.p1 TRINITY_DN28593_c0_g1~~TRINITY_DN28593_c0_g1_i1.p1  ORF type:complete len:149 (+),score=23.25 TRINITY_DN28593_c0_g1_i1:53-499(+)